MAWKNYRIKGCTVNGVTWYRPFIGKLLPFTTYSQYMLHRKQVFIPKELKHFPPNKIMVCVHDSYHGKMTPITDLENIHICTPVQIDRKRKK